MTLWDKELPKIELSSFSATYLLLGLQPNLKSSSPQKKYYFICCHCSYFPKLLINYISCVTFQGCVKYLIKLTY